MANTSTTFLRTSDVRANPKVPSWVPIPTNALDAVAKAVVCTTLPVERDPAAGVLLTSGVVLTGSQLNVSSVSSVAGDLSIHGVATVTAPLQVAGVMSVLGSLRTAGGAVPALGGMFVIGSNSSLTVTLDVQVSPSVVLVVQYGSVVGRFAVVNIEAPDGCQYALTAPIDYGTTSLTLSVDTLSGCGRGGLSHAAIIGSA